MLLDVSPNTAVSLLRYNVHMAVILRKIDKHNINEVLALQVLPEQEQFVSSVEDSLEEAKAYPEANPWYRAIYADDIPIGFVMLSWNVEPDPPHIIGPWFLWKFFIDAQYQYSGYGQTAVKLIIDIVKAEGATQLHTSFVDGEGTPWPFYERLGFKKTGEFDDNGEEILILDL